ncbi:MAG: hypothetical protein IIT50_07180, partial [Bacteroidales bacterium]|nr:hypothetical protein [Bacteroidales bacterium]
LGVMPYSTVAYDFNAGETSDALIAQVGDITYKRRGRGGLYQAVLGVGVTFWNRLSLGADANYYFGKIDRNSSASFTTNSSYRSINSGWSYNISCFGAKAGLQYTQPIKGASYFVVGATYGFDTKLRGHETRYAFGETSSVTDTIVFKKTSLESYRIPAELGVGLTFHQGDRWLLGFDYIRQDWTSLSFGGYPGIDFAAGVSQSFRAGFEVTPNRYDVRSGFGHFLRRLTWRGGAYRELSYLTLGGSQVATTGITLGLGIPVFRYYNSVNLGVDLGQRGSISNSQIRERYFLFTVSFNLHDIWFIPTLYN